MLKRNTILATLFGSVVTLAIVFSLGAATADQQRIGQYQIVASNHHAFIMDTMNGYAWTIKFGDDEYIDGSGDFFKAKR